MKGKEGFKNFLNMKFTIYTLLVLLFWGKTYLVYRNEFKLGIDNGIQEFLLFLNPLSSAIFFFAFALLFKKTRSRFWAFVIIDFLLSFVLYANVVYYRFFNDFITLPVLMQTKNFGDLGGSAGSLMNSVDILYFVDFIVILSFFFLKLVKKETNKVNRFAAVGVGVLGVAVFFVNLAIAEGDRPDLLQRTFDRNYLVKYIGVYNYTIYDVVQSTKASTQRVMAEESDIQEVLDYTEANHAAPNEDMFGIAEGKNVVYVSMESFQSFLMNYELEGQEVTPFLNSLMKDKSTVYFENFFHQTGQGKTSDSEFLLANSMYALPQGSVFSTKAQNTYQGQPAILSQNGYTTSVFHGNNKTFWNRDVMYKSLGYDNFFDETYYDVTEDNSHNYGLMDKPWFEQSMPYMEEMEQPFMAKFITLTHHYPFTMPEKDQSFPAASTGDSTVDHYFQTAHYFDEALEQFFNQMKESGLYEDSVFVLYGDHYGISENHDRAMSEIIGKEVNDYQSAQLQRVPLFIHVPGENFDQQINSTYGGQIDLRPTVLHMLGIETDEYISFGTDLFSEEHNEIVPLRNGNVITPEFSKIGDKCYSNPHGEEVEMDNCEAVNEIAQKELELSDEVVYGDLLRFYQPSNFEAVNPNDYDYLNR